MAQALKKKHEIPKSGSITVVICDSGQAQNRGLRLMQFTVVITHLNEEDVGMKFSMYLLHGLDNAILQRNRRPIFNEADLLPMILGAHNITFEENGSLHHCCVKFGAR